MKRINTYITSVILLIIMLVFILRIMSFSYLIEYDLRQKIYLGSSMLIFIPFIINFFQCSVNEIKHVAKTNIFTFLYLGLGLFVLIQNADGKENYTFIYELFFLSIGVIIFKSIKNLDVIFKAFIIIITIINILTIVIYFFMKWNNNSEIVGILKSFIIKYTFYENFSFGAIYSNPNYAGVVTGICLLIGLNYLKERKFISILFSIYSVLFIYFQTCRSAEIALLCCLAGYLLVRYLKWIKPIYIVNMFLSVCLLISVGLSVYIYQNSTIESAIPNLSQQENKINLFSSSRYLIWKLDLNANKDNLLLGTGGFEKEKEARNSLIKKVYPDIQANQMELDFKNLNAHNGYIGTAIVRGIIGLFLFLLILFTRLNIMDEQEIKKWYLCLGFIFIINLFESYYITETFVSCFFMMLMMGSGNRKRMASKKLL